MAESGGIGLDDSINLFDGYQVCQKWLKDRQGRTLAYDDLTHYQMTVAARAETIRLMAEIDDTIEGRGGWPLDAENTGEIS